MAYKKCLGILNAAPKNSLLCKVPLMKKSRKTSKITIFCLPSPPPLISSSHLLPSPPPPPAVEEVLDPETDSLVPERTYGCLPADEQGLLQCKGHLVPHFQPRSIACCQEEDLCNKVCTCLAPAA